MQNLNGIKGVALKNHDCFENSKVVDSRGVQGGRWRRRRCCVCKKSFATMETPINIDELPEGAKLDSEKVQRAFEQISHDLARIQVNLDILWPKGMRN